MPSALVCLTFVAGCWPAQPPTADSAAAPELSARADRIDENLEKSGLVYEDPALAQRIASLAARLNTTGIRGPRVLRMPLVNAFALPNGSVWLTTGLVAHVADEPQLAMVLAHEVAHLERRHTLTALTGRKRTKILTQVAGLIVAPIGLADPASVGLYSAVVAGYERDQELEADRDAVARVARAGYRLESLPAFFDEMDTDAETVPGSIFADHPSNAARKLEVQQIVSRLGASGSGSPSSDAAFEAVKRRVAVENVRLALDWLPPPQALREASHQLRFDPENAVLLAYRGDALRRAEPKSVDRLIEAATAYERALALDPTLAEAHRGLGYVALLRGDKAAGQRGLERYLAMRPSAPDRRFVEALLAEHAAEKTPSEP